MSIDRSVSEAARERLDKEHGTQPKGQTLNPADPINRTKRAEGTPTPPDTGSPNGKAEGGTKTGRPGVNDVTPPVNTQGETTANPDALPAELPGHAVLTRLGVTSLAQVRGMDRDALVALDGIGDKTADAILAYLKG